MMNFFINQQQEKDLEQSQTVMHFKSQRIDARVDHAIATIDITQVFMNELDTPVEATYQFPTDPDQNTVVSRVQFQLGDKIVESKITEKVKA